MHLGREMHRNSKVSRNGTHHYSIQFLSLSTSHYGPRTYVIILLRIAAFNFLYSRVFVNEQF